MRTAALLLVALLAGCASIVRDSFSECLSFGGSPSYTLASSVTKFECRR